MGNTSMPTPVLAAGAGLCLLAGYLIGAVAGPDAPTRTVAQVATYDEGSGRLCLVGDTVTGLTGADADGRLCGTWRRSSDADDPERGDAFRFVSLATDPDQGGDGPAQVVIYGDVVGSVAG